MSTNRNRTITRQVPTAPTDARRADLDAAVAERNARRKLGQVERFRDLDFVEDEIRRIFCLALTAGDTVETGEALSRIQDICRERLGLPAARVVQEIADADVVEVAHG